MTAQKLKIGFIKLGLKTYFKSGKESNQGSNHELVDVFHIFQDHGHECYMISKSDTEEYQDDGGNVFDWIFVFNGFAPKTLADTNMNMMKQPIEMIKKINKFEGKVAYFWTDVRYDPKKLPITKKMTILSQEPEHYAHLEKLVMYHKSFRLPRIKEIDFGILMNWTEPKRAKNAIMVCNELKQYDPIIIGDWKKKLNEFLTHDVKSTDVLNILDNIKFSWNQTTNPKWVSQKFWEMIMSNVICFHFDSDSDGLVIPAELKVFSADNVRSFIEKYQNEDDYVKILNWQKSLILKEYFDGSFMYKTILSRLQS